VSPIAYYYYNLRRSYMVVLASITYACSKQVTSKLS